MAGSWVLVHGLVAVILLALVLVHDPDANWSAQCNAELCTGLDLHAVLFVAGSCDSGLAGSAARHLGLNVILGEGHTRRAAVNYGADGKTVGFTIARQVSILQRIIWYMCIRGDPEVCTKGGHCDCGVGELVGIRLPSESRV